MGMNNGINPQYSPYTQQGGQYGYPVQGQGGYPPNQMYPQNQGYPRQGPYSDKPAGEVPSDAQPTDAFPSGPLRKALKEPKEVPQTLSPPPETITPPSKNQGQQTPQVRRPTESTILNKKYSLRPLIVNQKVSKKV
jgi:hypothetical protein